MQTLLKDKRGISLIEVLVASSLLAILGSMLASTMVSSFKAAHTAEVSLSGSNLNLELINLLNNSELCTATLKDKEVKFNQNGEVTNLERMGRFTANAPYDNKIEIKGIYLSNVIPYSLNYSQADLNVSYQKKGEVFGSSDRTLKFTVYLKLDGNKITSCFSQTQITAEVNCTNMGGLWVNNFCQMQMLTKEKESLQMDMCKALGGSWYGNACKLEPNGGWSPWSACSKECNDGKELGVKTRVCNSPLLPNGQSPCVGSDKEVCNTQLCVVPINGDWSSFTACSKSCDDGTGPGKQTRYCNNPAPQNGGALCDGKMEETVVCGTSPCRNNTCSEVSVGSVSINATQEALSRFSADCSKVWGRSVTEGSNFVCYKTDCTTPTTPTTPPVVKPTPPPAQKCYKLVGTTSMVNGCNRNGGLGMQTQCTQKVSGPDGCFRYGGASMSGTQITISGITCSKGGTPSAYKCYQEHAFGVDRINFSCEETPCN